MAVKHDANTDIVRGRLFLFIGDLPIAFASSASLKVVTEETDVTNGMMGDWAGSLPGRRWFSISSESLLSRTEGQMSFDTLLDKQIKGETLGFSLGEAVVTNPTNTGGEFGLDVTRKSYRGTVMITSLVLKSDNGSIISWSAVFKGVGALEAVAPDANQGGGEDVLG